MIENYTGFHLDIEPNDKRIPILKIKNGENQ